MKSERVEKSEKQACDNNCVCSFSSSTSSFFYCFCQTVH